MEPIQIGLLVLAILFVVGLFLWSILYLIPRDVKLIYKELQASVKDRGWTTTIIVFGTSLLMVISLVALALILPGNFYIILAILFTIAIILMKLIVMLLENLVKTKK